MALHVDVAARYDAFEHLRRHVAAAELMRAPPEHVDHLAVVRDDDERIACKGARDDLHDRRVWLRPLQGHPSYVLGGAPGVVNQGQEIAEDAAREGAVVRDA